MGSPMWTPLGNVPRRVYYMYICIYDTRLIPIFRYPWRPCPHVPYSIRTYPKLHQACVSRKGHALWLSSGLSLVVVQNNISFDEITNLWLITQHDTNIVNGMVRIGNFVALYLDGTGWCPHSTKLNSWLMKLGVKLDATIFNRKEFSTHEDIQTLVDTNHSQ